MKKLITLILTLSIALGAFVFSVAAEGIEFFCDVNGDGETDNLDSALILKYDAGLKDSAEGGDANGDGTVDNLDAAMVLKYDAGLDPFLKACGFEARYVRFIPDKYLFELDLIPGASPMFLTSVGDLEDYLGDVTTLEDEGYDAWGSGEDFAPYEEYDESFFEGKVLLLLLLQEGSGSMRNKVDSVTLDSDGLNVVMEHISPEIGTDDIAFWTVFIALDKSCLVPSEKVNVSWLYTHSQSLNTYGLKPCFTPTPPPGGQSWPAISVIDSLEEYEEYLNNGGYDYDATLFDTESFNSVYGDSFGEGFFESNYLIAIVTPPDSANKRYRVGGGYYVEKSVPRLEVVLESYTYYGSAETGCWHVILEMERWMVDSDEAKKLLTVKFINSGDVYGAADVKANLVPSGKSAVNESPFVAESAEELQAYLDTTDTLEGLAPTAKFWQEIKAYDEGYFEEKCLLIVPLSSWSADYEYKGVDILSEGNSLVVDTTELIVYVDVIMANRTDGYRSWHLLIELDKKDAVPDDMIRVSKSYVYDYVPAA